MIYYSSKYGVALLVSAVSKLSLIWSGALPSHYQNNYKTAI